MNKLNIPLLLLLLLLLPSSRASYCQQTDGSASARLKADVEFLCSPELAGRAVPGETGEKAAEWLLSQFELLEMTPAFGDTSFIQEVPLETALFDTENTTLAFTQNGIYPRYIWGDEFYVFPRHIAELTGSKPLVLETDTSRISGSAVVVVAGDESSDPMKASYAVVRKARGLARQGASIVVYVSNPDDESWPLLRVQSKLSTVSDLLVDAPGTSPGTPVVYLKGSGRFKFMLDRLREAEPNNPYGARLRLAFRNRKQERAFNIVGIVEGEKREYIVVGAHYDHLGALDPSDNGAYYPGADDNASGVAGLLEICRLWSAGPGQKRGLIAVAFSAEEDGLLGSRYFVDHLPVDRQSIVAMVNLDMMGREAFSSMGDLHRPGATPAPRYAAAFYSAGSPELRDIIRGSSANVDLEVEARPVNGFSYFGDAGPFHEAEIPTIHLFGGYHADYHETTDTVDKLNFEKLSKMVMLANGFLVNLSSVPGKPAFDPDIRVDEPGTHH